MESELEQQNVALVTRFCEDWAKRDINLLADYLADDLVYQMFEGRPDLNGRQQFIDELGPFLEGLVKVEWEILRSYAVGELVINERIDHFVAPEGKPDMHFGIAGWFLVRDGKIQHWRDYALPGFKQQFG